VREAVLVTEDEMLRAIATLPLEEHLLAEPVEAASSAALLKLRTLGAENAAPVVSGGNFSPDVLLQALGNPAEGGNGH